MYGRVFFQGDLCMVCIHLIYLSQCNATNINFYREFLKFPILLRPDFAHVYPGQLSVQFLYGLYLPYLTCSMYRNEYTISQGFLYFVNASPTWLGPCMDGYFFRVICVWLLFTLSTYLNVMQRI